MHQHIAHLTLLVKDYDEAIAFYTQKLSFRLVEDTRLSDTKRWVLVSPPGSNGPCILLAKAEGERQLARVGDQTSGRVFLYTDNFRRDYEHVLAQQVKFVRPPKEEAYGTVAVFEDLYGNLRDLLQHR